MVIGLAEKEEERKEEEKKNCEFFSLFFATKIAKKKSFFSTKGCEKGSNKFATFQSYSSRKMEIAKKNSIAKKVEKKVAKKIEKNSQLFSSSLLLFFDY